MIVQNRDICVFKSKRKMCLICALFIIITKPIVYLDVYNKLICTISYVCNINDSVKGVNTLIIVYMLVQAQ